MEWPAIENGATLSGSAASFSRYRGDGLASTPAFSNRDAALPIRNVDIPAIRMFPPERHRKLVLVLLFLLLPDGGTQDVAQRRTAIGGTELGHGLLLVLDLQRLD